MYSQIDGFASENSINIRSKQKNVFLFLSAIQKLCK